MNPGVPRNHALSGTTRATAHRRPRSSIARTAPRLVLALLVLVGSLVSVSAASAATTVGLGTAASFSVLAGSTVTNTGATTMFGDLGLSPGSEVTGNPVVLGQTHVADAVAVEAKNSLTTAFNNAAGQASNGSAGTDLAGQSFSPGVYTASEGLLLSAGNVTLNAGGNPNAVFIFQIASTLITGSNTTVLLTNGAQACNVFWKVGSSATLGTGTHFVGTIMASAKIAAQTGATIHGRLLAETAAVTLDTNTITNSNCPSGGGTETTPSEEKVAAEKVAAEKAAAEKVAAEKASKSSSSSSSSSTTTSTTPTAPAAAVAPVAVALTVAHPPLGSKSTVKRRHRRARHQARRASRRTPARPARPQGRGAFTG